MARQCIFCGGSPVTKEHIFATWLSPLFPAPPGKKMFADYQNYVKGQPPAPSKRRHTLNLDMQVKQVCESCNGGWMSDLEVAVMEVLPSICDDSKKSITQDEQTTLANWAVKTAIMIQYTGQKPFVPLFRRKWVFEHHTPPPDTGIWIARYGGEGIATAVSRKLVIDSNSKLINRSNGQAVFFSIGSLFFVVLCLYFENVRVRVESPAPIMKHLSQIFPPKTPNILWPDKGIDDSIRASICDINNWNFILGFHQLHQSP
jgi:hypothetical protein